MKHSILLTLIGLILSACQQNSANPSTAENTYKDAYNVAFLVMDGVYNTELTAPYDIFQHTKYREGIKPMNVFTIAKTTEMIHSFEGLAIKPDFSYRGSYPDVDILVVPSAEHHIDSDLEDSEMIEWVRETAQNAEFVCSHCDGSFVLAKAGLLDGRCSTTFPADIQKYRSMFPRLDVRDSVLFVHDGKFISSVGGARSFDAALYLCEYIYGKDIAERLADGLVIDWNLEELNFVRIED